LSNCCAVSSSATTALALPLMMPRIYRSSSEAPYPGPLHRPLLTMLATQISQRLLHRLLTPRRASASASHPWMSSLTPMSSLGIRGQSQHQASPNPRQRRQLPRSQLRRKTSLQQLSSQKRRLHSSYSNSSRRSIETARRWSWSDSS
jgi:hypothetical protein